MKSKLPPTLSIALVLAILNLPAHAAGESAPEALAALKAAGPQANCMLYPVRVLGRPDANVADVLGLVLEKRGMTNLETAADAFAPPDVSDWTKTESAFAEFVKARHQSAPFAIYAEYLGDPKAGPTEVRWLVANADGRVLVADRQGPSDRAFRKTAARDRDPLGCSACVADRLFALTGWTQSRTDDPNGRFARIWAEKSGTPTQAEHEAMQPRRAALKSTLKKSSITIYPTRLGEKTDAASAQRLAEAITKQLGVRATPVAQPIDIRIEKSSNEQKLLWDLARAFRNHLRIHPAEGDYALLADDYLSPTGQVGAVHFVLCTRSGDWVIVDFQNNQSPDFQRISPKSIKDCDRLVEKRLTNQVK